jgi:hypothetical protein
VTVVGTAASFALVRICEASHRGTVQVMMSKKWYWVGALLVVAGIGSAVGGCRAVKAKVESLQRVVMPARAEIALPAGDSTLYTEQRSIVDGKVYETSGEFRFSCRASDPGGGKVALENASSSVTYGLGDFGGHNTFDLHVETAGTYVRECQGPRTFVIAVGSGVGTRIVFAVVAGLVPVLLGVLVLILTLVLRVMRRSAMR